MDELKITKTKKYLSLLIALGVISVIYFFTWWLEEGRIHNPWFAALFASAAIFVIVQVFSYWFIIMNAKYPKWKSAPPGLKVDVFVPTYNEPLWLVEKAARAARDMHYPHNTYLIDDGKKEEYKKLAQRLGICYITRQDNLNNKAGNINNALKHSKGDFIAIFDIDHAPSQNYLERSLGLFSDPKVGVVQVMLDHANENESTVSAASCQLNDDFFGPSMLGMYGCDSASVFGSNSIFRREALNSIGGYKPGLAEDLNTSIHLHADRWRSEYVPEVLAKGLVPADLIAFFKQQLKWSRGVFEILFEIYPRLAFKLSFKKNVSYLVRMTSYLAGPVIAVHIFWVLYALFSADNNQARQFADYLFHAIPLIAAFLIIQQFAGKNLRVKPLRPDIKLNGLLLVLGTWPVYTLSFVYSIFRIKLSFIATPKEAKGGNFIKLVLPQIIAITLLATAIVYRLQYPFDEYLIIVFLFALGLIGIHSGVFYAVWESLGVEKKTEPVFRKREVPVKSKIFNSID